MRSASQWLMIKTDTTLDQDRKTEDNCVCMYSVHHVSSTTSENFNTSPVTRINSVIQDSRAKLGSANEQTFLRFVRMTFDRRLNFNTQKKKTRSYPAQCESFKTCQFYESRPHNLVILSNQSKTSIWSNALRSIHQECRIDPVLMYEHSEVLRYVRIQQIRLFAVVDSLSNHQSAINHCSLCYSLLTACFSSSLSPVMVHSSWEVLNSANDFIQSLHPSRCSQSVILWFLDISVVECGIHGKNNVNSAKLQCYWDLKWRLTSFLHLRNFSL